jgi:hypothetical protein
LDDVAALSRAAVSVAKNFYTLVAVTFLRKLILLSILFGIFTPSLHARGRQPEDNDVDKFPDYNRLEMHPKPKNPQMPAPDNSSVPVPPISRPSLNTPANPLPSDEEAAPKPPPTAVPLPDGASEPPMPDDMLGTLVPSATGQMPIPK